jgi:hypothetical protein
VHEDEGRAGVKEPIHAALHHAGKHTMWHSRS